MHSYLHNIGDIQIISYQSTLKKYIYLLVQETVNDTAFCLCEKGTHTFKVDRMKVVSTIIYNDEWTLNEFEICTPFYSGDEAAKRATMTFFSFNFSFSYLPDASQNAVWEETKARLTELFFVHSFSHDRFIYIHIFTKWS